MFMFGKTVFFAAAIIVEMGPLYASAQTTVDVEKRVPQKSAEIGKTADASSVTMFRDADKKASITKKTKVISVSSEKKFSVNKNNRADKFNPRVVGANKLSMQRVNRYAYRKSNSSNPGVPVKKAAGDDDPAVDGTK